MDQKEIAKLESINDQLITELTHIDEMLKNVGYSEGIVSLREENMARILVRKKQNGR